MSRPDELDDLPELRDFVKSHHFWAEVRQYPRQHLRGVWFEEEEEQSIVSYEEEAASIVRIPLFGDYWADVQLIGKQEEDAARAALLGKRTQRTRITPGGTEPSEVEEELDGAAYTDALLVAGIAAWNLTGKDGAVWPIDLTHVAKLKGPHANKLIKAITDLGAGLDPLATSAGLSGSSPS